MNHRKPPPAARAAVNAAPRHGLEVGGTAVVLNRHAQTPRPIRSEFVYRTEVIYLHKNSTEVQKSRDCVVAKRGLHSTTIQPVQCSSLKLKGGFLVVAKLSQLLRRCYCWVTSSCCYHRATPRAAATASAACRAALLLLLHQREGGRRRH